MSPVPGPRLTLFVAGEPRTVPSLRDAGAGLSSRLSGMFVGDMLGVREDANVRRRSRAAHPASDGSVSEADLEWYLPPDQMTSLNLVLDVAGRRGHEVTVVDANRPGNQHALVDQYVRPNDVFPLLIRWDGARLDGTENFTPARVRRFLDGR